MNASGVANLIPDDDIRHGTTRDGHHDDTFPLLDRLLEDLPEVVERFVLPGLDPTALALLARVGRLGLACGRGVVGPAVRGDHRGGAAYGHGVLRVCRATRVGESERLPVELADCALAARGGQIEVLRWARELDCPWSEWTCAYAARGRHLDVLMWARDHDCPWDEQTCALAAAGGHLDVLQWAREHDCPVGRSDVCKCSYGRAPGRADVGAGA